MKTTTYRMFERILVGFVALGLIGIGLYLLPIEQLTNDVEVTAGSYAFKGSVPVLIVMTGAGLLVALVIWGGASSDTTTTETKLDRKTTRTKGEAP